MVSEDTNVVKTEMTDEMIFSFFESTISDFKDDLNLTRKRLFFYENGIKLTVTIEYDND